MVQHRHVVDVADRDDGAGEPAFVPRALGPLLALDRIGVDVVAAKAVFGGDQIGGNPLRHEIAVKGDCGVRSPGAAGCAHGHAAHAFDAAADGKIGLPRHDLRRGHVGCLQAGRAKAVDLNAGHGLGIVGVDRRDARDVGALLAHRLDTAEDDVVDVGRIKIVAIADGAKRRRREIDRGDAVQRAVLPALAARRAHRVVDIGLGHVTPFPYRSRPPLKGRGRSVPS